MKYIILTAGFPAAGKSTIVDYCISQGYESLSRDVEGGSLHGLSMKLEKKLEAGVDKIVLDNTYMTLESRAEVLEICKKYNARVVCYYLTTSIEDCMVNAVSRMIQRHGKLFDKAEDYKLSNDANMFPIAALYRAKKIFVKPTLAEGFNEIKIIPFVRKPTGNTAKAILLDYDGTLRHTKSGNIYPTDPSDIEILPNRIEKLKELQSQGYILLGVSNQSGIAKGLLSREMAVKCFEKTNELLGLDIDYRFCGHSVPPITCYCRKPGVGFGVEFIEKYKLDPAQCIMVGDMGSDNTFAKRCGFKFVEAEQFFKK